MTKTRYRVIAAVVSVKTMTGPPLSSSPWTMVMVYRGGILPSDAPDDDIQRLLRKEAIVAEEYDDEG